MNESESNNLAFCLSEYLANEYQLNINEYGCFILGSLLGLQLFPKSQTIFTKKINWNNIDNYYLESLNPMSIESFCSTFNALLRIDQNNDYNDIKWIEYDFYTFKRKTLVTISHSILNMSNEHFSHHPLYALIHIEDELHSGFDLDIMNNKTVIMSYAKNRTLLIKVNKFLKYWGIKNNELFNTNRYVIIPPCYRNLKINMPTLFKDALIKQYLVLAPGQDYRGVDLIINLKNNLKSNLSEENFTKHINLLKYSYYRDKSLNIHRMNRNYFSNCLKMLYVDNLINNEKIINSFMESGEAWNLYFSRLSDSKNISRGELLDVYDYLIEKEDTAVNSLKNVINKWL